MFDNVTFYPFDYADAVGRIWDGVILCSRCIINTGRCGDADIRPCEYPADVTVTCERCGAVMIQGQPADPEWPEYHDSRDEEFDSHGDLILFSDGHLEPADAGDSTCLRCGAALNGKGRCTDVTCPFSDHAQTCKRGWAGHPEHDPKPTDDTASLPCTC